MKKKIEYDDSWIEAFKNSVESVDAKLPENGWERLSGSLPERNKGFFFNRKRWISIAAVFCGLLITGGYILWQSENRRKPIEKKSSYLAEKHDDSIKNKLSDTIIIPENKKGILKVLTEKKSHYLVDLGETAMTKTYNAYSSEEKTSIKSVDIKTDSTKSISSEKVKKQYNKSQQKESVDTTGKKNQWKNRPYYTASEGKTKNKYRAKKWAVSLAYNTMQNNDFQGTDFSYSNYLNFSDPMSAMVSSNFIMENGIFKTRSSLYSYHHKQPIGIRLTFQKQLYKNFAVETGVAYTLLLSDVTLNNRREIKQDLNYLSIPVRLNWTFLRTNENSFYIGSGISPDYCIYGKRGSEKIKINKIQWSVETVLGAQYKISEHIGLYLEGGCSYHIKTNLPVETIWQKNKAGITLQIGVRYFNH